MDNLINLVSRSGGNAKPSDVLEGVTFSSSLNGGIQTGTMPPKNRVSNVNYQRSTTGNALSYTLTRDYPILWVSNSNGDLSVSGTYDSRVETNGHYDGVARGAFFFNVKSGTKFSTPKFDASVGNRGIDIWAIY